MVGCSKRGHAHCEVWLVVVSEDMLTVKCGGSKQGHARCEVWLVVVGMDMLAVKCSRSTITPFFSTVAFYGLTRVVI